MYSYDFETNTNNQYHAVLTVSEVSQSIENNQTTLEYRLVLYVGRNNFTGYTIGHEVYINGSRVAYHDNNGAQTSMSQNSSKVVCSGRTVVSHDSHGGKTISLSAKIWTNNLSYLPVSLSVSSNMTLTTIPRATTPVLSAASIEMGEQVTITTNGASSNFTHKLSYQFGGVKGEIGSAWTPPVTLAKQIPSNTRGTAIIKCETYSGGTLIGSKTANLELIVPASVKPAISGIILSEAATDVTNKFALSNKFVKTLSKLLVQITVDTQNAQGAVVSSYTTEIDKIKYSGNKFTTKELNNSGSLAIKASITDSRGRTSTLTKNITVIDYAKPQIDLSLAVNGNKATATISGKVFSVDSKNTKKLVIKHKKISDVNYSTAEIALGSTEWTFEKTKDITVDPEITHEIVAELTDKMGTVSDEATTGVILMSRLAGGKGVCFFGEATREGLEVKGPVYFNGRNVLSEIDGKVQSGGVTGEDGGHKMALSWNGSRVIVGIDNNAAVKTLLDTSIVIDYIIGHHISGGWEYIKWASGRVEAWRRWTSTNLATNGTQGGFYYRVYALTLPSGLFKSITDAHADCHWGTGTSWASARNVTTEAFEAIYYSNQNGGAGTFYNYVRGKWK